MHNGALHNSLGGGHESHASQQFSEADHATHLLRGGCKNAKQMHTQRPQRGRGRPPAAAPLCGHW